jgi:hypothetical protein
LFIAVKNAVRRLFMVAPLPWPLSKYVASLSSSTNTAHTSASATSTGGSSSSSSGSSSSDSNGNVNYQNLVWSTSGTTSSMMTSLHSNSHSSIAHTGHRTQRSPRKARSNSKGAAPTQKEQPQRYQTETLMGCPGKSSEQNTWFLQHSVSYNTTTTTAATGFECAMELSTSQATSIESAANDLSKNKSKKPQPTIFCDTSSHHTVKFTSDTTSTENEYPSASDGDDPPSTGSQSGSGSESHSGSISVDYEMEREAALAMSLLCKVTRQTTAKSF